MNAEDNVREAEAILTAIERGTPIRPCEELAKDFLKAIELLEGAGCSERSDPLVWDYRVCLLHVQPIIIAPADKKGRFTGKFLFEGGRTLPDPDDFPYDAMTYYATRAAQVTNPVLKARYNDFLWEKSSFPDKHKCALAAIDAYLESARQFAELTEVSHSGSMIAALDSAAVLSIRLGQQDKVAATVATLVELMERLREVNPAEKQGSPKILTGRWTIEPSQILLYIRQQRRFADLVDDEVLARVQQMSDELATLHADAGNYFLERPFLEVAAQAAFLRADHEAAYNLRLRCGESLEREAEGRTMGADASHLEAAAFYEDALEHYAKLRSDERTPAERRPALQQREAELKCKIREMYRLGRGEMKPIGVPIEIPYEEYEQIMAYFLEPDTLEGCLERVASEGSLLPNVEFAKDVARQTFESGFLSARLPVGTISEDMSVAEAISDDERFQAQVDLHLLMQIEMKSHFILSELFTRLRDQKGLNADSLWQYLDGWGLIDEDNLEIIRAGLERYFDGDYVSALHLLVPQFEDVLRTAFEKDGAPVIKPRKGRRGWQFETLGDFLQHDFVKKTIPLDLLEYIRLVLADPTGGNLRNRVAHGLIHPQECTKPVVDIVLHFFLILTRFRVSVESQVQTEEEI